MSQITVRQTAETDDGWRYDVAVKEAGRTHTFRVTLSRTDRERWSPGGSPPEQVVRAAFAFLLAREPVASILSEFDCSIIRRYFPDVDRELPRALSAVKATS